MNNSILIVFRDYSELILTRDTLREGLSDEYGYVQIDLETNVDQAITCFYAKAYQLVVSDNHIPQNKSSAINESANLGLELLKEVSKNKIPSILVLPGDNQELQNEVKQLSRCIIINKGTKYGDQLLQLSKFLLNILPDIKKTGYVKLELDLDKNQWRYTITSDGLDKNIIGKGLLTINSEKMVDLIKRTSNIQHIYDWNSELNSIGKTLFEEIIKNNYKFSKDFNTVRTLIDDDNNIRIHFGVERKIHPVLLEALREEDKILMLDCPIFRSIDVSGTYNNIFRQDGKKREPINCLIIESDVRGDVQVGNKLVRFRDLSNIKSEADWLENYFLQNYKEFNIGRIGVARRTKKEEKFFEEVYEYTEKEGKKVRKQMSTGSSFIAQLREIIGLHSWELLHYAGHSYYDDQTVRGYIILPPDPFAKEFTKGAVEVMEFSQWLRPPCNTQLVFLSSCHSSEENFVFELAFNKIPGIIGFRWDIDDDKALIYAQNFYTHLFKENMTLEYAFLEARRDMHGKYEENRIWAAPMLIMQTSE
jgi:hypothetical protein